MRKVSININDVIQNISKLKGEEVKMQVNKGRRKILKFNGVIENIYPSIFIVRLCDDKSPTNRMSCSYSEVLCGNVKIISNKN